MEAAVRKAQSLSELSEYVTFHPPLMSPSPYGAKRKVGDWSGIVRLYGAKAILRVEYAREISEWCLRLLYRKAKGKRGWVRPRASAADQL